MEFTQFMKPELMILVPVLWLIGTAVKRTPNISNWEIPYLLGIIGVILSALYVFATECICLMSVFTAVTQGVLLAGTSVWGHQLVRQAQKAKQGEN